MKTKRRNSRSPFRVARQSLPALAPAAVLPKTSFQATLRAYTDGLMQQRLPQWRLPQVRLPLWRLPPDLGLRAAMAQRTASRALAHAWSWLQVRYKVSAAKKRLRVSETVSLGEKRFVALVNVEGREFLIGGGASGVSLLAQLGTGAEAANALQPEMNAAGNSQ